MFPMIFCFLGDRMLRSHAMVDSQSSWYRSPRVSILARIIQERQTKTSYTHKRQTHRHIGDGFIISQALPFKSVMLHIPTHTPWSTVFHQVFTLTYVWLVQGLEHGYVTCVLNMVSRHLNATNRHHHNININQNHKTKPTCTLLRYFHKRWHSKEGCGPDVDQNLHTPYATTATSRSTYTNSTTNYNMATQITAPLNCRRQRFHWYGRQVASTLWEYGLENASQVNSK